MDSLLKHHLARSIIELLTLPIVILSALKWVKFASCLLCNCGSCNYKCIQPEPNWILTLNPHSLTHSATFILLCYFTDLRLYGQPEALYALLFELSIYVYGSIVSYRSSQVGLLVYLFVALIPMSRFLALNRKLATGLNVLLMALVLLQSCLIPFSSYVRVPETPSPRLANQANQVNPRLAPLMHQSEL